MKTDKWVDLGDVDRVEFQLVSEKEGILTYNVKMRRAICECEIRDLMTFGHKKDCPEKKR